MATNFPTTLDSYSDKTDNVDSILAAHVNNLQDAVEALQAKMGVDGSAVTDSIDYLVNNFFTSGRKLYLYENTAPTGWSTVSVSDRVLAVKGGSNNYDVNGGNTGGTWTQPDHDHGVGSYSVEEHNHRVVNTYDYSNELRQKTGQSGGSNDFTPDAEPGLGDSYSLNAWFIPTIKGDELENHLSGAYYRVLDTTWTEDTNPSFTGSSSSEATTNTWRPAAVVGIIISKD